MIFTLFLAGTLTVIVLIVVFFGQKIRVIILVLRT
jgi:hypothetical protein